MALDDKVAQTSGSQPDRVAALATQTESTQDLVAQLVQFQQKQDSLTKQQAELPSMGDNLKSPAGIASLIAALGGAASGDSGIAAGGMGVLEGFMGQREAQTNQQKQTIQSAQQQTQKILDANRQRLSTMITSRPDLFIDPETGTSLIDPRMLGYASTGFLIPIDPGAAHHLAAQTATQKLTVEMGMKLMLDGDTPEKRRQGGVLVSNSLGLGLDDQFFEAIAQQDETTRWSTMLSRDSIDPTSVLRAWTFATQNGRQMSDPEVLGLLRGATKKSSGKYTYDDKAMDLVGEFNKIMAESGGALQNESLATQLEFAFEGREGDLAMMKKHFLGNNAFGTGVNGTQMLSMMRSTGEMMVMLYMMNPEMKWLKDMGINSVEDIWAKVGGITESAVGYLKVAQADEASANFGRKTNQLRERLMKDNPDMSVDDATIQAWGMVGLARGKSTQGAMFDVDMFNDEIKMLMED